MSDVKKIDKVNISVRSHRMLQKLFDENPQLKEIIEAAESFEEALEDLLNPALQQALAANAIADAKKEIKDAARGLGVDSGGRGDHTYIVWKQSSAGWDSCLLEGLALAVPEVLKCKKPKGAAYPAIQQIKK